MKLGHRDDKVNEANADANQAEATDAGDAEVQQAVDDVNVGQASSDGQSNNEDQDLINVINDQQARITELTNMVQRTRADFENYRKHTEADLARSHKNGEESVIKKLLPIIDVLDSAMATVPDELAENDWAKGVVGAHKNLTKMMADLQLSKQAVKIGDAFDHNQHEAILFEDGEGDQEVIAEILRPGYLYNGAVLRPAMVKVTKK